MARTRDVEEPGRRAWEGRGDMGLGMDGLGMGMGMDCVQVWPVRCYGFGWCSGAAVLLGRGMGS
jgi:hypothetical protein